MQHIHYVITDTLLYTILCAYLCTSKKENCILLEICEFHEMNVPRGTRQSNFIYVQYVYYLFFHLMKKCGKEFSTHANA